MPDDIKPFMAQLSDDLKTNDYLNSFENFSGIASKALSMKEEVTTLKGELEKSKTASKNLVRVPDENSTEEELAAFKTAIGVPGALEDYKFTDGETELNAFEDKDLATGLRKVSFDASLTAEQSGKVALFINERELKKQELNETGRSEARKDLEKQLYDKYKDDLPKKVARLREFMLHYAPKSAKPLLEKFNLDNDWELTAFMMEFADQFAEDGSPPKSTTGGREPVVTGQLEYKMEDG